MKYKLKEKPSELVVGVEIVDTFKVHIRYVSPMRLRKIGELAGGPASLSNPLERQADPLKERRLLVENLFVGWEGLYPAILDAMVEFDEGSPKPQPNGDGTIPFDMDLAEALWVGAWAESFQNKIWRANQHVLAAKQADEDLRKNALEP